VEAGMILTIFSHCAGHVMHGNQIGRLIFDQRK
jgi:hypothetical protein